MENERKGGDECGERRALVDGRTEWCPEVEGGAAWPRDVLEACVQSECSKTRARNESVCAYNFEL